MRNKIYRLIATVFGIGYSPVAPGTMGSLAGLGLCLLLHKYTALYILVFLALFASGVIVSKRIEKEAGEKDPSFIVIDEFACILIAFLFVPIRPMILITGFAIYRFIDISKIFPLKRLERLSGGWAVMLDDLAAGIYTNLALQVLISLRVL
ncbi:MAG: phosphatidylglycerophosphatase A [Candidatus Omnitrophota bacterium]